MIWKLAFYYIHRQPNSFDYQTMVICYLGLSTLGSFCVSVNLVVSGLQHVRVVDLYWRHLNGRRVDCCAVRRVVVVEIVLYVDGKGSVAADTLIPILFEVSGGLIEASH